MAATIFYLDIGLEELLFAVEYDGEEWHSADDDVEYDETRRELARVADGAGLIEPFRKQHVYGRHDAEATIFAAYQQARASLGARTYIAMSAPR